MKRFFYPCSCIALAAAQKMKQALAIVPCGNPVSFTAAA
jgi:hypothetical protein